MTSTVRLVAGLATLAQREPCEDTVDRRRVRADQGAVGHGFVVVDAAAIEVTARERSGQQGPAQDLVYGLRAARTVNTVATRARPPYPRVICGSEKALESSPPSRAGTAEPL